MYCYDDFSTLRDILGSALIDVENGRIRDELFEPNQEDLLVQALRFEEMEEHTLTEAVADAELTADGADAVIDGDEGEGGASLA